MEVPVLLAAGRLSEGRRKSRPKKRLQVPASLEIGITRLKFPVKVRFGIWMKSC